MMRRIDIFYAARSQYGVLDHFTEQVHLSLKRLGIESRLLQVLKDDPDNNVMKQLMHSPPECTLSFNGLLPNQSGYFLADSTEIPHIACIVDSPHYFLKLSESTHTIVTCPDRFASEFFTPLFKNPLLFMPHAVEREYLLNPPEEEKIYPVVMLASCVDYMKRKEEWRYRYTKPMYKALKEAADIVLSDQVTPFVQAMATTFEIHSRLDNNPHNMETNSIRLLDELEKYVRGKDRTLLVKRIKDAPVHVFGSNEGDSDWNKCLEGAAPNIHLNPQISFFEAKEVMKRAKIILNSCPSIKSGGHERIFNGIALGGLVITSENDYLKQFFKDNESIVFYQHGRWDEINDKVNYYLSHEKERRDIVEKGREIVLKYHTWDIRVRELLENIAKLDQRIFLPAATFSQLMATKRDAFKQ